MEPQDRWPLVSMEPRVQAHYEDCRRQGTSHNLAEMFALGQAPALLTDAVFLEGHCNGNQFEDCPHIGDFYQGEADAAGVDTTGKIYLNGLARFPGDPEAWVSDRSDVKRICETRGWSCQGAVDVKAQDLAPPPPDVDVAPDIVEQRVLDKIAANPDLEHADQVELHEQAKDEIKPHWAA